MNLIPKKQQDLSTDLVNQIGQAANEAAASFTFADNQERRADNTNRRQAADLVAFENFLVTLGLEPGDLFCDPVAWTSITWGLVRAF